MSVDIHCGMYPKEYWFRIEDSNPLDNKSLGEIRIQSGNVMDQCAGRQGGGDCTGNCPIPQLYLANYRQIKKAILQART